ncbi:MAG TPA: NHL repeat-containing protein, partial [Candidatus Wallbacteria bacterium]|nr:NHL repeat-containing protein [Candidatus Wallbacteria bacterium]
MILGSTAKSSFSLNENSSVKIDNSLFNLYYPNEIHVSTSSVGNFSRNDFNVSYNTGQGADEESFIMTKNPPATLILNANNFYDGYFSAGNRTNRFNGSKISLNSVAYINNNFFLNSDQPIPPAGGTSCEICIADSPFVSDAWTGVWPEISGNYFLNNQLPVYISGFNDAAPFRNKIKNNYFINSAALISLNNNSIDSPGVSSFVEPGKAALDNEGFLYIIDRKSGSYYKFNSNGEIIMRVGARGMGNGEFKDACAITVNLTGEVYVLDAGNKRIQKFDKYGNFINKFNVFGEGEGKLKNPTSISTVTLNNSEVILVTDKDRNRVLKFSNEGEFMEEIGDGNGGLNAPVDIAASHDQKFAYVADSRNNRIVKVQLNIDEYKTERFEVALKVYSTVSSETSGFTAGDSCEEGEYFEINVAAKNSAGDTNIDYKPFGGGKIITDFTGGAIYWEGAGIIDNSASSSDNGASFGESAFTKGCAKFYARCSTAGGPIKIFIHDNVNANLKAGAVLRCVPENVPWGLNFIGINQEGFRRYSAVNDPEVKFIKIPGSNFISGHENAGGIYTEVKMSPYYIAETLTTNAQFNRW